MLLCVVEEPHKGILADIIMFPNQLSLSKGNYSDEPDVIIY